MFVGCGSGSPGADSSEGPREQAKKTSPPKKTQGSKGEASTKEPSREKPSGKKLSPGRSGGSKNAEKVGPGGGQVTSSRGKTVSALSWLEEADELARGWRKDAELYSIASISPDVTAQGRSDGWIYAYVSTSEKGVALISVEEGKAEVTQKPPLPESQIQQISARILPPADRLIDSSEAIEDSEKVQSYIEENPEARVSVGLDAFSSREPAWILLSISRGGRVQDLVPATS